MRHVQTSTPIQRTNHAVNLIDNPHNSHVLINRGRFLLIETLLYIKMFRQHRQRQFHHHHGHVLTETAPAPHKERHVREGFRVEPWLPPLWVELFGVGPVLWVHLHHVLGEVYPDVVHVDDVRSKPFVCLGPGTLNS